MEIILRHITKEDTEAYFKAHDEDAAKFFATYPTTMEEAAKEVQEILDAYEVPKEKRTKETFAIDIGGMFAGFIAIHHIVRGKEGTTGSLVAPEFRGRGVGTQAHKLLLAYAFKTYKLKKIYGRTKLANKASQRMLEKSGYKYEKTIETEGGKKKLYVVFS